ncbi:hypothetical protein P8605_02210 [Streptomyces sp. T-3]|nr:hypothetical protein [Streptomyces sp. T-3]
MENFLYVFWKASIAGPAFADTTLLALWFALMCSASQSSANFIQRSPQSRSLSSSAVGQLKPSISRTHSSSSGSMIDTAALPR